VLVLPPSRWVYERLSVATPVGLPLTRRVLRPAGRAAPQARAAPSLRELSSFISSTSIKALWITSKTVTCFFDHIQLWTAVAGVPYP